MEVPFIQIPEKNELSFPRFRWLKTAAVIEIEKGPMDTALKRSFLL